MSLNKHILVIISLNAILGVPTSLLLFMLLYTLTLSINSINAICFVKYCLYIQTGNRKKKENLTIWTFSGK